MATKAVCAGLERLPEENKLGHCRHCVRSLFFNNELCKWHPSVRGHLPHPKPVFQEITGGGEGDELSWCYHMTETNVQVIFVSKGYNIPQGPSHTSHLGHSTLPWPVQPTLTHNEVDFRERCPHMILQKINQSPERHRILQQGGDISVMREGRSEGPAGLL